MALYELQNSSRYEITLLTTVTGDYERISMHGVRRVLLERQAESLGLELEKVYITKDSGSQGYESRMLDKLTHYKNLGVRLVAFGDIFLEDLKRYREANLAKIGMEGVFPIWKRDTPGLARKFIDLGFKAIITCVDSELLAPSFAGRLFDEQFLSELPPGVDPCGENGEFHSFVYDGPPFRKKVSYKKGDVVCRQGRFYYCDLIPV